MAAESLTSLYEHTPLPFRLIVVDPATPSRYLDAMHTVLARHDNWEMLHRDQPLLPAASKNLVLDHVGDDVDYVCLLENDNLFRDGWLEALIDACERCPADVAAPLIREGRGEHAHFDHHLGSVVPSPDDPGRLQVLPVTKPRDRFTTTTPIEFVEQHCVLFRRSVFDRIGKYDETLNTRDEVDLSLALRAAGARVVVEPRSIVNYVPPTTPPEPDELEFYRVRWDLERAAASRERIREKWSLVDTPGNLEFVQYRNRIPELTTVRQVLEELCASGRRVVLLDDGDWFGTPVTDGLPVIPFPDAGGSYGGFPESESAALDELDRVLATGVEYVVVGWPARWWFEHLPEFADALARRASVVRDDDLLRVFTVRGHRRAFWDGRATAPEGWHDLASAPSEIARNGLDVGVGEFDAVFVGPSIGQVVPWELVDVLTEFRRVITAGGRIHVAAYDLDASVLAYVRNDRDFFWDQPFEHRSGDLAAQLLDNGATRSLLTAPILEELLRSAGFDDPQASPAAAFGAEAVTPPPLDPYCCHVEATNAAGWSRTTAANTPASIHLAWGDPQCRTVDVVWTAPAPSTGSVRFRTDGTAWSEQLATSWSTIDGSHAPQVFRATLGPLRLGSVYEYEIAHHAERRTHTSARSTFRTLPDGNEPITFAFLADTGIVGRADSLSDASDRVVRELAEVAPHFVLGGGDYASLATDRRWSTNQEAVLAWLAQMAPVARRCPLAIQYGNHDVGLGERYRDWAPHFPQLRDERSGASRSYSFDAGPCHVVGLYAPTPEIDPAEVAWLWEDLATARERAVPWIVVFQHEPLVAHGTSHPADARVASALSRVLEHHHVDLVLSAHDQSYERTYPLVWQGAEAHPASSDLATSGRGVGVVLAKVSPGGKRSDRGGGFSELPLDQSPLVAVREDTSHHFAVVDVAPDSLRLRAYGIASADAPLVPIDELVISA
jgi:GT2 family glycosyltransferase